MLVSKPGTGVILPAYVEVWKIPLKPRHGIPHDVFPVSKPSGKNDLSKVIDGTGITRKERGFLLIEIFSSDPNLTLSFSEN